MKCLVCFFVLCVIQASIAGDTPTVFIFDGKESVVPVKLASNLDEFVVEGPGGFKAFAVAMNVPGTGTQDQTKYLLVSRDNVEYDTTKK